jgi:hypothetical protein
MGEVLISQGSDISNFGGLNNGKAKIGHHNIPNKPKVKSAVRPEPVEHQVRNVPGTHKPGVNSGKKTR